MIERRRKHDDAHRPLAGRGKRAPRGTAAPSPIVPHPPACRQCWMNPCRCVAPIEGRKT